MSLRAGESLCCSRSTSYAACEGRALRRARRRMRIAHVCRTLSGWRDALRETKARTRRVQRLGCAAQNGRVASQVLNGT
eukprot:989727-Pleurochrysis_carterae.AAC.1